MSSVRQLRYFIAAAEQGSASKAAIVLNVSQPSVSTAVRELEQALGQQLFERRQAKGLELTLFGRRKLLEARRLIEQLDAFTTGPGLNTLAHPSVAIGYFTTVGPSYVPSLLNVIRQKYPRLQVELREDDLDGVARLLKEGRIELAITYDIGLPESAAKHLLCALEPYAVLPVGHRLAELAAVPLERLAEDPFILVDLPLSREFLMLPFWQRGLAPSIIHKTKSVEMVRGMVASGLGVSLLTTRPRHDLTFDGRQVVCRPIAADLPRQRLVLAHPGEHQPTAAAKGVIDCIRAHFDGRD